MRVRRLVPLLALILGLGACASTPGEQATGEQIYIDLCARCHSEDLSGGIGPALDAGSEAAERPDEYYRTTILRGRGSMPAFDNSLTDEQVDRVIAYLREQQAEG